MRIYIFIYLNFYEPQTTQYTGYWARRSQKGEGNWMKGNRPDLRRYRMAFSIVLGSLLRAADRSEGIERE